MSIDSVYTRFKSGKSVANARAIAKKTLSYDAWVRALSDADLANEFSSLGLGAERISKGFALIREAARRSLGTPHYEVQLIGGLTLLDGHLAEMSTGEGKTLTVTLAAALLAQQNSGVHVVTANEYLALRDAELMRPVYELLGLSVSAIHSEQTTAEKQEVYARDIVYGVGSEFGFDYLKDHLIQDKTQRVQRSLITAIVDEVDSVLIDEARVPLIISGPAPDNSQIFQVLDACVRDLTPGTHYLVNLKERTADLTDAGYRSVESSLVESGFLSSAQELYALSHLFWVRQLHSAVKAYGLFKRDRDYVVKNGEIILVDLGTGRTMEGRRFDDGLHEAIEAKEGVKILQGNVVKATITYQNYFSKYSHLCGLSGTALTDAEEFQELYGLKTVVIPTNRPVQRKFLPDIIYPTKAVKFQRILEQVQAIHATGQPLLVGCSSIRDAEVLDSLLSKAGVPHNTLTAKHVDKEAHIIAKAGEVGAVTVATNMAGRGTDIILGGERPVTGDYATNEEHQAAVDSWRKAHDKVLSLGGLFVLGTERNGLRRVDNQLAGRAGRQGDPGTVQFLMSKEDELLKVFGNNKQLSSGQSIFLGEGALSGNLVTKLVTSSQQSYEQQGFSARKNLMKYDSALAEQRQAVFDLRDRLLESESAATYCIQGAREGYEYWLEQHITDESMLSDSEVGALKQGLAAHFGVEVPLLSWVSKEELTPAELRARLRELGAERLATLTITEEVRKKLTFEILDNQWEQHLANLSELRENVALKGFTGLNAVFQFHNDAFELFNSFKIELNHAYAFALFKTTEIEARLLREEARNLKKTAESKLAAALHKGWISRNMACPCESGLRFKECHGVLTNLR